MRTTITIPDAIVHDLHQYAHTKKTTEAINIAIKEWVKMMKIQEIMKLKGRLAIDNNLSDLRKKEIQKIRKLNE